ncbi:DUF2231 domain-containing protein [Nitrospina gracilis]|nr:DUF2231 domain-containing protein [Nitrospinaceae bacterium]MBN4077726.1 DUF2231 domain-containing protein [Nitrospina gracilis]
MNIIELIPNLHPIFVHFTVGLLSTSAGLFVVGYVAKEKKWAENFLTVARWNLWLGAAITIITVGTGLYEYYTVQHDEPSHSAMTDHRNWALATAGFFWILTLWSVRNYRWKHPLKKSFITSIIVASMLLMLTGWKGGELVYQYGLGVKSLPQISAEDQGHSHDSSASGDNHGH